MTIQTKKSHQNHSGQNLTDAPAFQELRDAMTFKTYIPGSEIFFEGDECRGVYFLESGIIGIRKTNADGGSALLHLVFAGQPFGYEPILAGQVQYTSTECIQTARIGFIDRATFLKFMETKPGLVFNLLKRALNQLHEADDKVFQTQTFSARARLAQFLCELKKHSAQNITQGDVVIEIPVNRRYLAELIGVRPETVSRTIKEFEVDGLAMFAKRMVRIPNIENLLHEAESAIAA